MIVLAFDLGLNVGWAILRSGTERPIARSFRIPYRATQLGEIAQHFEQEAAVVFAQAKPDLCVRAKRFVTHTSNPIAIGPYFGLSMVLDRMALERRVERDEIAEPEARNSFLGGVPRKSKTIKQALMLRCAQLGWPAQDDHVTDAICVGLHAWNLRNKTESYKSTPLFSQEIK